MCERPAAATRPGDTLRPPHAQRLPSQRRACESWRTQELPLCIVPTPRFPQSSTSGALEGAISVERLTRTSGRGVGGFWFHLLIAFLHVGFPFFL